ncbi:MAG: hypothetical protein HY903_01185 [Deltaproteobacteria bacterium]|nr:hypothetical protein [Deltaproteobacteria bacterium]
MSARRPTWSFVGTASPLALAVAGCMSVSQNVRPRVVDEGDLRLGTAAGVSRDVAQDFARAAPSTETRSRYTWAPLAELSAHYGIAKHMDLGLRLRPLARGAKLEYQLQLLDPRGDVIGLAVGLGIDGFYRTRTKLLCEVDGCFFREYGGVVVDLPLVVSRRTVRWLTLFAAVRGAFLVLQGRQTYEAADLSFASLRVDKQQRQPIAGVGCGLLLEWASVKVVPQVNVATLRLANGATSFATYPSLDLAFEL